MRALLYSFFLLFTVLACQHNASEHTLQNNTEVDSISAPKHSDKRFGEMRTYYMVLLKSGPTRNQDSTELATLMEGHLNHIKAMVDIDKIVIAGPFLDKTDLRGIFIFNSTDSTEVDSLVNLDPAIKAGRLIAEIHPWYSASGACLPE